MAKVKVPSMPDLYTTKYETLRGVDYSVTPAEVSKEHSPDMVNMISDKGGNPIKRVGWRKLKKLDSEIKDIHSSMDSMYIATDKNVYKYPTYEKIFDTKDTINNIEKITIFSFDNKLGYTGVADGKYFYKVGKSINDEDDSTIPTMIISKKPDGTGGEFYQPINMLTPYRSVEFLGDSTSKEYRPVPKPDENTSAYRYVSIKKVEVKGSDGQYAETKDYTLPPTKQVEGYDENGKLKTYTLHAPYITFTSPHAPVVTGQDNVKITYMAFDDTKVNDKFEKDDNGKAKGLYNEHYSAICTSGVIKNYGYQNNDRVFILADNNRIYYSQTNDPLYIPDENYIAVTNTSKVVGLHRYDKYLVVITEDNEDEASIYFVHGIELKEEKVGFALETSSVGVGALNYASFDSLIDEPLFLAQTGIYGISNHYATTRLAIRRRSMFIDKKLLQEPNLKDSVACVWDNYYILAVNNKCYVLDGRQTTGDRKNNTNYSYEAYYWEDIPVKVFGTLDNELYFGDFNGNLCKFNSDITNYTAFQDDGVAEGNKITGGVPIRARYSTLLDYDGRMEKFKTLNKKGNTIVIKPYQQTSCDVYFSINGQSKEFYDTFRTGTQSFEYVSFRDFSFAVDSIARNLFIKKKIKKYKALQLIFENNNPYEPFGIIAVVKTYMVGNFAK